MNSRIVQTVNYRSKGETRVEDPSENPSKDPSEDPRVKSSKDPRVRMRFCLSLQQPVYGKQSRILSVEDEACAGSTSLGTLQSGNELQCGWPPLRERSVRADKPVIQEYGSVAE